jgi:SRSO17 transposase
VFRPKWQIALDLLNRSLDEGMHLSWLTADEGYGQHVGFRHGVAARNLRYIVEVPRSLTGWTQPPKVQPAGFKSAKGPVLSESPRPAR